MKQLLCLFLLFPLFVLSAQENDSPNSKRIPIDSISVVDDKYREDQFYASVTYNLLGNKPEDVSQNGFSSGFHFGFIRDMPINSKRNVAIGIGVGLSTNSFNQTLLISERDGTLSYNELGDTSFNVNKFSTYLLEFPVEFRWRTSTVKDFDFWRIYSGVKVGYVFYNSSKFRGDPEDISLSNISDINKIQVGLTLSAGYSNVSFYLYYAVNNIFNGDARIEDTNEEVAINAVKIGLIFYIL